MCVRAYVRVCVRACVCCVCVWCGGVRACVRACVCNYLFLPVEGRSRIITCICKYIALRNIRYGWDTLLSVMSQNENYNMFDT